MTSALEVFFKLNVIQQQRRHSLTGRRTSLNAPQKNLTKSYTKKLTKKL